MALSEAGVAPGFSGSGSASRHSDVVTHKPLSRDQHIREWAFLCFSDSYPHSFVHTLTAKEWKKLLHWLDVSGLALYFLDRLTQIGQRDSLPGSVVNRLERSLEENRQRTRGLIEESVKLQRDFQSMDISYAVMKGVSLYPVSVPRPELRHQFDLDFLIAGSDAPAARQILERHGYTLFAISGRSWEFKKGQNPRVAAKDLYRDLPYRGVELHLETKTADVPTRLQRSVSTEIHGLTMPVLSPVDLFLGQAIHASKDISGPFLRASHLLEFYRHVLARRDDIRFWEQLRLRACDDRRACLAIGMVTYLITLCLGRFRTASAHFLDYGAASSTHPALGGPLWSSRHLSSPSWKQTVSAAATRVGDRRRISWIVEIVAAIFQSPSRRDSSYAGRDTFDASCPISRADSFSRLSLALSRHRRASLRRGIAPLAPAQE